MPDSTALHTDSIFTTDSVAMPDSITTTAVVPLMLTKCREEESPTVSRRDITTTGHKAFTEGLPCEPRTQLPGYDSGVMCLIITIFLIITSNFRHYSTFIKTFTQNLFSVRTRANAFDDKHTTSETRVLVSLVILTCISEGILLFSYLSWQGISLKNTFAGVGSLTIMAMCYYLWQMAAYSTVGYVFTTTEKKNQWVKGFHASQSLLGIAITIPALLVLFNPAITPVICKIAILLYVISRTIFISKGFRIFYHKSFSLIYFILYLCSLEIIPLILMYKLAFIVTSIL